MITQEGVHNVLVEAMSPVEKVKLSAACKHDPEKIKGVEQRMADILNVVVDITVNPGTIYMNTKTYIPEGDGKKLKSLRKYLEEAIGEVPMKDLSTEALLSIVYSKNMTGIGPSMLSVLADYVEYIEEFLSTPRQEEDLDEIDYKEECDDVTTVRRSE